MNKVRYAWSHIFIIVLFASLLWSIVYPQAFKYSKAETLHLFITSEYIQTDDLKNQLMSELTPLGIKKIIITYVSYDDPYYSTQLLTQGILEADILILPKVLLDDFNLLEQFKPIDTDYIWSNGFNSNHFTTLTQLGQIYALSIYESSGYDHFGFNHRFDESIDYYVVFNLESVHANFLLNTALISIMKRD